MSQDFKSFEEFAKDVVEYIQKSCPKKFYLSGANDSALLKFLYSISVPSSLIKMTAENEARKRRRFCLSDIREQILNKFKAFMRSEPSFSRENLRDEVVPRERLSGLKNALVALIVENLNDVDEPMETDFLKRIEELKGEASNEEIERQLCRIENDFYSFLLRKFPNAKSCMEESMRKLDPYKYYWKSDTYRITLRALIKRCLKERFNVPEFTIT